jgi:hypothetical protein
MHGGMHGPMRGAWGDWRPKTTMNTDTGRLALLHTVHTSLMAEMLTLKNEIREKVARMEVLQRRIEEIEQAQNELTNASGLTPEDAGE